MPKKGCADLSFTQDCIDPFDLENPNLWVKIEHLGRYLFAADYLRDYRPRRVADIACGMGYGLNELAKIADFVVAVDRSSEVLKIDDLDWNTDNHEGQGKIDFHEQDLESLPWSRHLVNSDLDAIISFETLEHLIEPELVIAQFSQSLNENGWLICSVPNALHEPPDRMGLPVNPYHKQLFNFSEFRRLLDKHSFQVIYRLGQASSNILFKRESQLLKHRSISQRIGDFSELHSPAIIRHLTYLLAYPTVSNIDGSYALIVVARKK